VRGSNPTHIPSDSAIKNEFDTGESPEIQRKVENAKISAHDTGDDMSATKCPLVTFQTPQFQTAGVYAVNIQ
jgi:hypothetical protein